MRIIAALSKRERAAFLSHLDIQRTLQRAMRRADLPLLYSKGFNPHPELHFAAALATGEESVCEWFDTLLETPVSPDRFTERLNAALPEGLSVSGAFEGKETGFGSLTGRLVAARYEMILHPEKSPDAGEIAGALAAMLSEKEIIIQKRTKGGIKPHDMRPQILSAVLKATDEAAFTVELVGSLTASGGLRTEAFAAELFRRMGTAGSYTSLRTGMYFDGTLPLPVPEEAGV